MATEGEDTYLTTEEVAQLLRCSVSLVRRWSREDALPYLTLAPRVRRYSLKAVTQWAEARRAAS